MSRQRTTTAAGIRAIFFGVAGFRTAPLIPRRNGSRPGNLQLRKKR